MPTVLITGASRGIGRALSEHLVTEGWTVYAGVRDLATAPSGTIAVRLDVTNPEHRDALADVLPDALDAVINNAGVVLSGPIEALSADALAEHLEMNVVAQVAVTTAVLPKLRVAKGRVLYVSSLSGRVSTPMTGAYNASKFALEAIADAQRVELLPWNVRVILIEPGPIDTDIWRGIDDTVEEMRAGMSDEHRALYAAHLDGFDGATNLMRKTANPVEKVVAAAAKALTARHPRTRYLVGTGSRVQLIASKATPTFLNDWVLAKAMRFRKPR